MSFSASLLPRTTLPMPAALSGCLPPCVSDDFDQSCNFCDYKALFQCSPQLLATIGIDASKCIFDPEFGGNVIALKVARAICPGFQPANYIGPPDTYWKTTFCFEDGHCEFTDLDTYAQEWSSGVNGGCELNPLGCPLKNAVDCADVADPGPIQQQDPTLCPPGQIYNPRTGTCDSAIVPWPFPFTQCPPCQRLDLNGKCQQLSCDPCFHCDVNADACIPTPGCVPPCVCVTGTEPCCQTCPQTVDCDGVTAYQETPAPCGPGQMIDKQSGCCRPCCCEVNRVNV